MYVLKMFSILFINCCFLLINDNLCLYKRHIFVKKKIKLTINRFIQKSKLCWQLGTNIIVIFIFQTLILYKKKSYILR